MLESLTVWGSRAGQLNSEEDFLLAAKLEPRLCLREALCWDGTAGAA